MPVVRDADTRDLTDLAAEARRLVNMVALAPSHPGTSVASLGVGRVVDRATRGDGDAVVWRKVLTLSLTLDHRAVDGAPGERSFMWSQSSSATRTFSGPPDDSDG